MESFTVIDLLAQRDAVIAFVQQQGWKQDQIIVWLRNYGEVSDFPPWGTYVFRSNVEPYRSTHFYFTDDEDLVIVHR